MRSLYLRIYLTVVVSLALFALVSGWFVQRHMDEQRLRVEGAMRDRAEAWGELIQRSLPAADAPPAEQLAGLRDWSQRLRIPMALDDPARDQRKERQRHHHREVDAQIERTHLAATVLLARKHIARTTHREHARGGLGIVFDDGADA